MPVAVEFDCFHVQVSSNGFSLEYASVPGIQVKQKNVSQVCRMESALSMFKRKSPETAGASISDPSRRIWMDFWPFQIFEFGFLARLVEPGIA